jgi:serine/threonine protein kinase
MENFEIIEKLGEGSYSTVYKVRRNIDNQIYALKKVKLSKLKEREKTNSLNEVRILASVKSKFVISYKEAFFDEKDNTLGIVMEYADNGDLYKKILEHKKEKKYFEEDEIWKIFIQLVKGLKSLHELNILHRDIKSANVFLFKDGHVKLGDLNVAKVAKRGLGYTQTGTPYYASPEVWRDLPYDSKSDIWSLGCVLYEMITLHPPFRASIMESLYKKVLAGDVGKIPEVFSKDLYELVLLLLKVNSSKRPDCNEILNNEFVQKKIEYFNSIQNGKENIFNGDENEKQTLLKTIHLPENMNFLTYKLPKPNYIKEQNINKTVNETPKNYDNNNYQNNFNNIYNHYSYIHPQDRMLPNIKSKINSNNESLEPTKYPNFKKINLISRNAFLKSKIVEQNLNHNINFSHVQQKNDLEIYNKLYLKKNSFLKLKINDNKVIYDYNNENNNENRRRINDRFFGQKNNIYFGSQLRKVQKLKIGKNNLRNYKSNENRIIYLKQKFHLYKDINRVNGNSLPKIENMSN